MLQAERATVWLYDADDRTLVLSGTDDQRGTRVSLEQGLLGLCARTGRVVNVQHVGGHPDFDPRFDHIAFSFTAACPSDLDCKTERILLPEPAVAPEINYLAKDYESFRQLILDRLALVTEALWTLLRERAGLTDQQLVERIQEVDLSDGQLDGKVRRPPVDCPACSRKVSRRNRRCLYCGAELPSLPF